MLALCCCNSLDPVSVLRPNHGSVQKPRLRVEAERDSGPPLCRLQLAEVVLAKLPRGRVPFLFRKPEIADRLPLLGGEFR